MAGVVVVVVVVVDVEVNASLYKSSFLANKKNTIITICYILNEDKDARVYLL